MLQRGQGKLVQRVVARLVLNAKCLTPIRNYHTRQSEVEYRLALRNNLHIASIKQFHKESVMNLTELRLPSRRYKPPSRIFLQPSRKAATFFRLRCMPPKIISGVSRRILLWLLDSRLPHPPVRVHQLMIPAPIKDMIRTAFREAAQILQGTIKSLSLM